MVHQQTQRQPVVYKMMDGIFKVSFFETSVFIIIVLIENLHKIDVMLSQLFRREVIFHCKRNKMVIKAPTKLIITF